jgi:hypothetical protein
VLAERVLADVHNRKTPGWKAWVLWLLGEIAALREPPEIALAETHYREALALAGELGMRPLWAHCHRGRGMLYAAIGQQAHAHAELTSAIEMYRDMEMTFWISQAEAALTQVK